MSNSELLAVGGNRIRVFVSYDPESDADLYDLLAEKALKPNCRFEVSARSSGRSAPDDAALRRAIRDSDQVIVICGEHTDSSVSMSTELRIAQEEERPYLLLWGRRERMCTKPATAKSADAIYSWTWEILERQLLTVVRAAWSQDQLAEMSRRRITRTAERSPARTSRAAEPGRGEGS